MATKKETQAIVEEAVEETVAKTKKAAKETATKAKKVAKDTVEKTKKAAAETGEKTKRAAVKARNMVAKVSVRLQYQGLESDLDAVVANAKAAYETAHPDTAVKTIEVYVKPEEGVAYYVVNGEGSDDFKVSL